MELASRAFMDEQENGREMTGEKETEEREGGRGGGVGWFFLGVLLFNAVHVR